MKRSDSTTPREALWPPPAPQVTAAIFAAVLEGKVTEQEIEAVEGLPPSKFPHELMIKLGFHPPPEDPVAAQALEELKAMGYPKTDHDPGNGETFQVFPEQIFYDDSHPLSGTLPDNARPENWRELESAAFNPSKAQSIWEQPEDEQAPVTDERIDAAIVAAIRSGAIGENELATIRRTSKSEWPEALWVLLGLPAPEDAPVRVRVEIFNSGTFHHITQNHYIHPYEGDEYVRFSRIQVNIYDTRRTGADAYEALHSVVFSDDDESLGVYSNPPHPPQRGVVDEVGCASRMEREIVLKVNQEIPVELGTSGISIGAHAIPWSDVTENGGLDCFYNLTAYWDGVPLGRELTKKLYIGNEKNPSPGRANLLAMLGEIHYLAAHTTGRYAGLSSMEILKSAGDDPFFLLRCALSLPWERARHIREPDELNRWMREHHPESPDYKGTQKTTKTKAEADVIDASDGDDDQGSEWPPDRFRILCAMRAARMAGSMTSQDVERMDEGPPESWPDDLWRLLGFNPPVSKTVDSTSPLTPEGELALNALLIGLKAKGLLTDEFISAQEGEILLNQPFSQWPRELQDKLSPHGAGPAIR
jgi:hypothetical protein